MEFKDFEPNVISVTLNNTGESVISGLSEEMEAKLKTYENLKLFLEIKEHDEENEASFFEELKHGLNNLTPFSKIAVVSPKSWIERYAEVIAGLSSHDF